MMKSGMVRLEFSIMPNPDLNSAENESLLQ